MRIFHATSQTISLTSGTKRIRFTAKDWLGQKMQQSFTLPGLRAAF